MYDYVAIIECYGLLYLWAEYEHKSFNGTWNNIKTLGNYD